MKKASIETIVYGGAFNPPTLAHQAILQACIDYAEPRDAEVWLLPSGNRADKTIGSSIERRLQLCDALIKDVLRREVKVIVDGRELEREELTQTYETVEELQGYYPDRVFRWVFGADSVAGMSSWENGEWMKDNLPMLIVDRPGVPLIEVGANAEWLTLEGSTISSTQVRRRMDSHEEYGDLVGSHVYAALQQAVVF